jgi:hypothetical protein
MTDSKSGFLIGQFFKWYFLNRPNSESGSLIDRFNKKVYPLMLFIMKSRTKNMIIGLNWTKLAIVTR